jgi:hypothetical protein
VGVAASHARRAACAECRLRAIDRMAEGGSRKRMLQ